MKAYQKHHEELVSLHKRTLEAYKRADTLEMKGFLSSRMYEIVSLMEATTAGMKDSFKIKHTTDGDFTNISAASHLTFRGAK